MASHNTKPDPNIGLNGYCNARLRQEEGRCQNRAGWGTNHAGFGACKKHGGSTNTAALTAARQMARVMGLPLEVTPHEALLYCVYVTAGAVEYCNEMIGELTDAIAYPTVETDKDWTTADGPGYSRTVVTKEAELNIWIRARDEYVDRLSKYSKMAIDARVDERLVAIAERTAEFMRPILIGIFDELVLTADQRERAPDILRRHLLPLEEPVMTIPVATGGVK